MSTISLSYGCDGAAVGAPDLFSMVVEKGLEANGALAARAVTLAVEKIEVLAARLGKDRGRARRSVRPAVSDIFVNSKVREVGIFARWSAVHDWHMKLS